MSKNVEAAGRRITYNFRRKVYRPRHDNLLSACLFELMVTWPRKKYKA